MVPYSLRQARCQCEHTSLSVPSAGARPTASGSTGPDVAVQPGEHKTIADKTSCQVMAIYCAEDLRVIPCNKLDVK